MTTTVDRAPLITPLQERTMDFATFVQAVADQEPLLPLYLCQGRPFALSPRLGQPVTCYVPEGTTAHMRDQTEDWAYLHWGNPPLTLVTVTDYPPEAVRPTWLAHMDPETAAPRWARLQAADA
jgi:hypothetical protein